MKRAFSLISLLATTSVIALAVGPKIPCLLSWTPSPTPDVTGYWFYYRSTAEVYSDTRRVAIATNAAPFDLRVLGLAKGDYYVAMSATNAWGESDLSQEFLWHYSNPNKPSDLKVQ